MAGDGRLTDWISLGVLASSVPRDAGDEAIALAGKGARRSDRKLPPHVMVYFAMAIALFAEEDYEEIATRLTETLRSWGCWNDLWTVPTSDGITQARKRLGPEALEFLFSKVAVPVAGLLTRGAFLRHWRLMAIDGFDLDVPDTPANATAFGYPAGSREHPAFPKVRVVTIGECGSHAKVAAQMGPVGGKGSSEQALARRLFPRLDEDWLLIADRGFYNWPDWQATAATGAALLWRVKADLRLPVLELLPDGSYLSVVARPALHDRARDKLIAACGCRERCHCPLTWSSLWCDRVTGLGIWLREHGRLGHCQYSCHYDWLIWQCSACSAGLPCSPAPTGPRMARSSSCDTKRRLPLNRFQFR